MRVAIERLRDSTRAHRTSRERSYSEHTERVRPWAQAVRRDDAQRIRHQLRTSPLVVRHRTICPSLIQDATLGSNGSDYLEVPVLT